jgi:hypothetical protein
LPHFTIEDLLVDTLIAVLLIALGISFAYKTVLAVFFGKVTYWAGFLPIGLISPLFVHLPAGKNSLIKTEQSWWVHITAGPIFLICSMGLLASGVDQLGGPGTETINTVLTLGRTDVPPAITYNRMDGYRFPIVGKAGETIFKALTAPVLKDQEEKTKMIDSQASTAK